MSSSRQEPLGSARLPVETSTSENHSTRHIPFDVGILPPDVQAQLAQYTVDLVQDYKPPRTNLACMTCRSRKIKCSGDRPMCKACTKSSKDPGTAAVSCDYPSGHAKRKRKVVEKADPKSGPGNDAIEEEEDDESGDEHTRLKRKPFETGLSLTEIPSDSHSRGLYNHDASRDFRFADSPGDWLALSSTPEVPAFDLTMLESSGIQLSIPPMEDPEARIGRHSTDLLPTIATSLQSPSGFSAWDQHDRLVLAGSGSGEANRQSTPAPAVQGSIRTETMREPRAVSDVMQGTERRKGEKLRVPYFRYFGATAIAPGYKRVTADVSAPTSPKSVARLDLSNIQSAAGEVMDVDGESPHPSAINHLEPIFRLHFSYFFPSWTIEAQQPSRHPKPAYLLNLMCALAARYSDRPYTMETWASKAKEQVGKQLAVANLDLVEALLMISWYEFGSDRDGGLWMYSGMAIRMAQDLGLERYTHEQGSNLAQEDGSDRARRLHRCLLAMDAIMTVGTGRTGMYQEMVYQTPSSPPLPTMPSSGLVDPFPYLVKILGLAKAATGILVVAADISPHQRQQLTLLQLVLNDYNMNLPNELRFETAKFQRYVPLSQGGCFVLIHLWFHTSVILLHDPTLLATESSTLDFDQAVIDGREISISSAKSILDIVSFAELIDPKAISQPWTNYPLYIAARVFIAQMQRQSALLAARAQSKSSAGHAHVVSTASANYRSIENILSNLEKTWAGVRYIRQAVSQKAAGVEFADLSSSNAPRSHNLSGTGIPPNGWLSNDLLGFSLTGTMNTPSDNRYTFVLPPAIQSGNGQSPLGAGQLAIVDQQTMQFDLAWAEAYLANMQSAGNAEG